MSLTPAERSNRVALERIQKILAKAGVASRREAERMLTDRRITVNGRAIDTLGFKADPAKDHIKVDGKRIKPFGPKVTFVLHKPRGYVSTVQDPQGRPTVLDLLKRSRERVYPVGRLDFDAEGLLLLSNDGDLTQVLSHPRFAVPRTYLVKVAEVPDEKDLERLRRGVMLEDGRATAVSVTLLRRTEKNCWAQIVVREGRNRLVKRMFLAIGHSVLKLKRVAFGPIRLGNLPAGHFRKLTAEELDKIEKMIAERDSRASAR
jgi:23S rRNA pseudouridine2605 synthase